MTLRNYQNIWLFCKFIWISLCSFVWVDPTYLHHHAIWTGCPFDENTWLQSCDWIFNIQDQIIKMLTRKNFWLDITWCLPPPPLADAHNEDDNANKDPDKGDEEAVLPHVPDQVVRAHLRLCCRLQHMHWCGTAGAGATEADCDRILTCCTIVKW